MLASAAAERRLASAEDRGASDGLSSSVPDPLGYKIACYVGSVCQVNRSWDVICDTPEANIAKKPGLRLRKTGLVSESLKFV